MNISTKNQMVYILTWICVASYYFGWGANEETVTCPIDDSGWVPDGAYASKLNREAAGDE